MQKKTVFILQENKEQIQELKTGLEQTGEFEVVGSATDGISAITLITDLKPKFLITGLVLSGYDGLLVVSKVKDSKLPVKIIVVSSMTREEIIQKAMAVGANYFMAKPFNISALAKRMVELEEEKIEIRKEAIFHEISLEEKISKIFINVGIPPHIKGYSFLREGVKMVVEEPDVINNITKKLYPSIGQKYNTSASKVERAIRHAIEVAWNRGRIDNINNILGVRAYVGSEKPTNGEFIALVADKMLLEQA